MQETHKKIKISGGILKYIPNVIWGKSCFNNNSTFHSVRISGNFKSTYQVGKKKKSPGIVKHIKNLVLGDALRNQTTAEENTSASFFYSMPSLRY